MSSTISMTSTCMTWTSKLARLSVGAALVAACSRGASMIPSTTAQPAAVPTAATAASRALPNDLKWFRSSAEYRALARQAYGVAGERLPELSRGLAAGSWGVILDADETILDNSEYERRRFIADSGYTDASWLAWVNERAAAAVPGSVDFTKRVRALGGRVVIVTNRADSLCAPTRANLASIGVDADAVLCQPPGESDKNPRFDRVARGSAASGLPPLRIVEWLGDNIMDFPHLTQAVRNDPAQLNDFGKRYFILPNPMYGSWQQNREP
jgi:5'-nucleotidase (lipoprotein e(P4) family)